MDDDALVVFFQVILTAVSYFVGEYVDFVSVVESVCCMCVDVEVVVIVPVLPAVVTITVVDFGTWGEVDCCKIFAVVDVWSKSEVACDDVSVDDMWVDIGSLGEVDCCKVFVGVKWESGVVMKLVFNVPSNDVEISVEDLYVDKTSIGKVDCCKIFRVVVVKSEVLREVLTVPSNDVEVVDFCVIVIVSLGEGEGDCCNMLELVDVTIASVVLEAFPVVFPVVDISVIVIGSLGEWCNVLGDVDAKTDFVAIEVVSKFEEGDADGIDGSVFFIPAAVVVNLLENVTVCVGVVFFRVIFTAVS